MLSSPLRCGCSLCVQQRTPSGQKTLRWDGKEGAWGGCCEGPARPESRESPWGSRMKEGKEASLLLRGGRQGRFCSWQAHMCRLVLGLAARKPHDVAVANWHLFI